LPLLIADIISAIHEASEAIEAWNKKSKPIRLAEGKDATTILVDSMTNLNRLVQLLQVSFS